MAYKKDGLSLLMYGIVRSSENKIGYTFTTVNELTKYCGLSRSSTEKVSNILANLENQNLIEIYEENSAVKADIKNVKNSSPLSIKSNEMVSDTDSFIQIEMNEINKFMMSPNMGRKKGNVLRQFIYILSLINQGDKYRKICYPSIETIAKETGISSRTVKNYNKILIEEKLLTYNTLIIGKEKVKNIYSRPDDSQEINDAIAESMADNSRLISIKKNGVSKKIIEPLDNRPAPLKAPFKMSELNDDVQDTVKKYSIDLNDNSVKKLVKYQKQYKNLLPAAIEYVLDGKNNLTSPTGFLFSQLGKNETYCYIYEKDKINREAEEELDRIIANSHDDIFGD